MLKWTRRVYKRKGCLTTKPSPFLSALPILPVSLGTHRIPATAVSTCVGAPVSKPFRRSPLFFKEVWGLDLSSPQHTHTKPESLPILSNEAQHHLSVSHPHPHSLPPIPVSSLFHPLVPSLRSYSSLRQHGSISPVCRSKLEPSVSIPFHPAPTRQRPTGNVSSRECLGTG